MRELRLYAVALLIACLLLPAMLPAASAELEVRKEIRAGDVLVNQEIIADPFNETLFHTQEAVRTDTEALAISPLSAAADGRFSIAQTAAETTIGTETGFFQVIPIPYILPYDQVPGYTVGSPSWIANIEPVSVAGLPANTALNFPDMTLVKRRINQTTPEISQPGQSNSSANNSSPTMPEISQPGQSNLSANNSSPTGNTTDKLFPTKTSDYVVDANYSRPYLPGNLMLVKTVQNEKGENETVVDRVPKSYLQLYATPEELANKTIIDRMWRDVHLNFNLDRAYSGETCYPDVICPLKNPLELMPWYPTGLTVIDALKMTRPGTYLKKSMWPVA